MQQRRAEPADVNIFLDPSSPLFTIPFCLSISHSLYDNPAKEGKKKKKNVCPGIS